jgi:hypothetical protein
MRGEERKGEKWRGEEKRSQKNNFEQYANARVMIMHTGFLRSNALEVHELRA